MRKRKGFTLIEMLIVIAIIAVLVSMIIPIVGDSTDRAKAAADAANLRATLGALNSQMLINQDLLDEYIVSMKPQKSQLNPDADMYVVYTAPGIIDVYYVDSDGYYGLEYLGEIAAHGSTDIQPTEPELGVREAWYKVGVGIANPPA